MANVDADPSGLAQYWPLFGLRVETPLLTLCVPTDGDLVRLAHVIEGRLHDPADMPFDDPPWTDTPSPRREREFMQRQWRARAVWEPDDWRLRMMALVDGEPVGMQDLFAVTFRALRVVGTYSWMGLPFQGKGYGKEMRAAILHLAFAGLGAREAFSAAFEDNRASIGVSRAVGYEDNGSEWMLKRGSAAPGLRFKMTRERWEALRRDDIRITGLDACLELFGATG